MRRQHHHGDEGPSRAFATLAVALQKRDAMAELPTSGPDRAPRLPLFDGLRPFTVARLRTDVVAGITLAVLAIPEVMGYAKIIGTPMITGLYTLFLPVVAFACFGASRQLVVSADSATAAMVAAALTARSLTIDTPRYIELTAGIALVTAAMLVIARVLRLAFMADFLSRTVLVGFLSGVGVQVALGQLKDMLGLQGGGEGLPRQLLFTIEHAQHAHMPTVAITVTVLAVIVGCERLAPRVPGALIAVIGLIVASASFHWDRTSIAVVGAVPGGLPHLGIPHLSPADVMTIVPIALSCFVVVIAQSAATSRAYALRYGDRFDENRDLIGLSLANLAAGLSGAFVVNGSPTKTAIVDTAGGRSQWAHLTTAAMVLVVLLLLTRPLSLLPTAVLAAIVFLVGIRLIDVRGLREIRADRSREFALALATAATVVALGVEDGIILAVVLSLVEHVRHSYRPHVAVIARDAAGHWRLDEPMSGRMAEPGLAIFWFGADLFYANVGFFLEQVRRVIRDSPTPVRWLVIDARAITDVDFSASRALAELRRELADNRVVLALVVVSTRREDEVTESGLVELADATRVFDSREACVAAYLVERAREEESRLASSDVRES
jgi:high affinity sulfate transporter 1